MTLIKFYDTLGEAYVTINPHLIESFESITPVDGEAGQYLNGGTGRLQPWTRIRFGGRAAWIAVTPEEFTEILTSVDSAIGGGFVARGMIELIVPGYKVQTKREETLKPKEVST